MDHVFLAIICLVIGAMLGAAWQRMERPRASGTPTPSEPRVIAIVPADYKPLEPFMVDGKPALMGPRALLYWSVYCKAMDDMDVDDPRAHAHDALRSVYGLTFDS